MAEDADARLEARQGAHALGDREHVPLLPALRHHDDAAPLAALPAPLELGAERVEVGRLLGDEHVLGPAGHTHPERDLAARAPHHLDQEEPLVRRGRVADAIDRLQGRVHGGVEADREVGAVDVVVDRSRHAGDRDAVLGGEEGRAVERPFAADDDQRLDAGAAQHGRGACPAPGLVELRRARGAEDRATALDDVGDPGAREGEELAHEQPGIAAPDAHHLQRAAEGVAHHRADRRVHARRVAAAGHEPDPAHHARSIAEPRGWKRKARSGIGPSCKRCSR